MTSRPQNQTFAPSTRRWPSIVARSPGYWRTMIGADAAPVSVLVNTPGYVPARSQTVSPGCTWPLAPARPVTRSHGRAAVPSPLPEPLGVT